MSEESKAGKFRAKFIELFNRLTPLVGTKDEKVYWNGSENLYPNEIELVIANSPTAKSSAKVSGKYIGGSGVTDLQGKVLDSANLPIVNSKKGYKITDIIRMASKDLARHGGVWFHIGWGLNENGELYQKHIDVLPYTKCRKSKEDDDENEGKIWLKDYVKKEKGFFGKKTNGRWFYPYSDDKKVVLAQIKADGKGKDLQEAIKTFRGNVFYLNLTPEYNYAISPFDAVYNDCDSEYRLGLYTNTELRTGFLGKLMVLITGLDEETQKSIEDDIASWLGSENSGSAWICSLENVADLDKAVKTVQLKPNFDDKLAEITQKRLKNNILMAANNLPEVLISAGDGSLFGTNSETYIQSKLFFSEQTQDERNVLEEKLSYLGFPYKIIPIIEKSQTNAVQ